MSSNKFSGRSRKPPKFHQLYSFIEVARLESQGKASEILKVSQPALSQQMRQLEKDVGTELFLRGSKGSPLRLTEAGRILHTHAKRAVESLRDAETAIARLDKPRRSAKRTPLVIGYSPSHVGMVIASIHQVLRADPLQPVETIEADAKTIWNGVAGGKAWEKSRRKTLDVAVAYIPKRRGEVLKLGVREETLVRTNLDLVVSHDHRFAARESIHLRDLKEEPLVLLAKGTRVRGTIDDYFSRHRFNPASIVLEANAVPTVLAAVREGFAVTILPRIRLVPDNAIVMRKLVPTPPLQATSLLWKEKTVLSSQAQTFIRAVRAQVVPG